VFPVAWSINCCCAIAGGIYVLNLSRHKRGRTKFLVLQSTAWGLFVLFDTAYFGLRSPMNAAAVTLGYTAVTAASIDTAVREMREPRAALALATTAAWLALANPLAIAQAAWNRDPFWKVGPFCEPPQGWEKLKGGADDSATEARTQGWDDADAER
jgi:tryptophan-rich sensory protein